MADQPNITASLPCIPRELIESIIIPSLSMPWLRVSKNIHTLAVKYVVNDSAFLENPRFAVVTATYKKNYAILDVLLADPRYTSLRSTISEAYNICPADKAANLIFLKHFFDRTKDRALARAITSDWKDVVEYIFEREENAVIIKSFGCMSESIFDFVIHHPKLAWNDKCIDDLAVNTQIGDLKKMEIMALPNINIERVISHLHEIWLDVLVSDQRVIDSIYLQKKIWKKIICGLPNSPTIVQNILNEKKLDPHISFNMPLRCALEQYRSTEDHQKIIKMLLDDDRVILTPEPFTKNVIVSILKRSAPEEISAKIKFILNHPKFKREWFEATMDYLLYGQLDDLFAKEVVDPEIIFKEHQFDDYLSEKIRSDYPIAMKPVFRALAEQEGYYNNYYNKMAATVETESEQQEYNDNQ